MQAKRSFVYSAGKSWMPVDPRNPPMPKRLRSIFSQLCHKHLGSSSKMELVMEAFCLHWKLHTHFQRFSLVPPWDLSFWVKAIGFHLFKFFLVCASVTAYSINVTSNLCSRMLTTCASVPTYSMNVTSDLCSHTLTACARVATYSTWTKHQIYVRAREQHVQA